MNERKDEFSGGWVTHKRALLWEYIACLYQNHQNGLCSIPSHFSWRKCIKCIHTSYNFDRDSFLIGAGVVFKISAMKGKAYWKTCQFSCLKILIIFFHFLRATRSLHANPNSANITNQYFPYSNEQYLLKYTHNIAQSGFNAQLSSGRHFFMFIYYRNWFQFGWNIKS